MGTNQSQSSLKKEIQFKALTDGLGFQPSQLLGNALQNPRKKAPTLFENSSLNSPVLSQKPVQLQASGGTTRPFYSRPKPVLLLQTEPDTTTLKDFPAPGAVYLLRRGMAYLLDFVLNSILGSILVGFAYSRFITHSGMGTHWMALCVLVAYFVFFNWISLTLQEVFFYTSLGKKIFGLRLLGTHQRRFLRALFFIPSTAFF